MHREPAASGQAAEKMKRPIVHGQAGRQQRNHQPSLHAMTLQPTVTCGPPSLQPTTRRAISEAVLFPVSLPSGWLLHRASSSRLTFEVKARTSPTTQTSSSARLDFLPVVIRNFRYFATSGKNNTHVQDNLSVTTADPLAAPYLYLLKHGDQSPGQ